MGSWAPLGGTLTASARIPSMWSRRLRRWTVTLPLLYLLASSAGGIFLADIAVHPGRRPIGENQTQAARELAGRLDASLAEVQISAADSVVLRAWSILPHHENGNSVILLHGLSDNRFGMMGYAELLVSRGYAVLMPDSRTHGESGGTLATYGLEEKNDIQL